MRNVTPKNSWYLLIKAFGLALGSVSMLALFKIAFDAFLSVSIFILPLTIIYFLMFKFGDRNF